MADKFTGKFKLSSSENFDEFLKELGVGFVLRNLAKTSTPTVEISVDGDEYTLKTITTFKTSEIKFKLGEEFEERTMDERQVQSVVTQPAPNTLLQVQNKGESEVTILREFKDKGFKATLTYNNVVSTRKYKRVTAEPETE